jgi:hypothetical protein
MYAPPLMTKMKETNLNSRRCQIEFDGLRVVSSPNNFNIYIANILDSDSRLMQIFFPSFLSLALCGLLII